MVALGVPCNDQRAPGTRTQQQRTAETTATPTLPLRLRQPCRFGAPVGPRTPNLYTGAFLAYSQTRARPKNTPEYSVLA
jgi:hypothetical protein